MGGHPLARAAPRHYGASLSETNPELKTQQMKRLRACRPGSHRGRLLQCSRAMNLHETASSSPQSRCFGEENGYLLVFTFCFHACFCIMCRSFHHRHKPFVDCTYTQTIIIMVLLELASFPRLPTVQFVITRSTREKAVLT